MDSQRTISYLDDGPLKDILRRVVVSAGGATDLAKIILVCKAFSKLGDEEYVLEKANFENYSSLESFEHWLHIRGLLIKCAEAGNAGAQHILAKVILFAYTQLLEGESKNKQMPVEKDKISSFLCYFLPEEVGSSNSNGKRFTHFQLVSLFLRRCNIFDHISMLPYLQNYTDYFGSESFEYMQFFNWFEYMTGLLESIIEEAQKRRGDSIGPEMINNAKDLLCRLSMRVQYNGECLTLERFSQTWERLKRECQFIEEELLSSGGYVKPVDEESKVRDMGKKFFYYLAFIGYETQEIPLPLDRLMDCLQKFSTRNAEIYNSTKYIVAQAFDEMFAPKKLGW